MLATILKHDIKESYKLQLMFLGITLVTALLFFLPMSVISNSQGGDDTVVALTMIFCILIFVFGAIGSTMGCQLYIAIRFYKRCFSSQGYFTFTTPATGGQILLSKVLVGYMYAVINMLFLFLCLTVGIYSLIIPHMSEFNLYGFTYGLEQIGFTGPTILIYLISGATGIFYSITAIYVSICVGQLFNKHKVLASIISYFSITTITQIVLSMIMIIPNMELSFSMYTSEYSVADYFQSIGWISVISSLTLSIIFYVICHYIMTKKVNLA